MSVTPADPVPEHPVNPYAAPEAPIGEVPVSPDEGDAAAEAVRRAHLGYEMNIKSLGSLHLLGALVIGVMLVVLLALASSGPAARREGAWVGVALYAVMFAVYLALGIGLRNLRPWARWFEGVLAALGLAGNLASTALFAVSSGTVPGLMLMMDVVVWLILGGILWLLFSSKGAMVFSPGYREIIARTPHVKYRTSPLAWVILLLILLGVASLFVFAR